MSAETLVARLERVKRTGNRRWQARCPAHDDNGPSLSVRELDDGRVLVHCFAGCELESVLGAIGLQVDDLFPCRPLAQHAKAVRVPFPAVDVLRCIAFEALVVATSGAALLAGQPFSSVDRTRLMLAVSRLQEAARAGGLRHE